MKRVYRMDNLELEGVFAGEVMDDSVEVGDEYFDSEEVEFYGKVKFMKGGIMG
ncbi:glycogen/starch synthase [Bacillus mycoides]|uniref:glycogen/starch synthase n=1 Tax=Bacillus mycoides TaxID=1405 RepID=UPI003CC7F7AC